MYESRLISLLGSYTGISIHVQYILIDVEKWAIQAGTFSGLVFLDDYHHLATIENSLFNTCVTPYVVPSVPVLMSFLEYHRRHSRESLICEHNQIFVPTDVKILMVSNTACNIPFQSLSSAFAPRTRKRTLLSLLWYSSMISFDMYMSTTKL